MDAVTPKCPSCSAPVQPDWDWCQLCGYDPESLMPAGWISPTLYQAEAAGGGTGTATKRRRVKRGRKADTVAPPPPPLIQLPENLMAAVDPITDDRAQPAMPPPVAEPSPSSITFDPMPPLAAPSNATSSNGIPSNGISSNGTTTKSSAAPAKDRKTRDKGRRASSQAPAAVPAPPEQVHPPCTGSRPHPPR